MGVFRERKSKKRQLHQYHNKSILYPLYFFSLGKKDESFFPFRGSSIRGNSMNGNPKGLKKC